nr:hypothetical protein CPGR_01460 [Mycolicibacterium komanii]
MRPLARVQAEALRSAGADVLLVTSDRHPESDAARDYELVLDPRFKTAATWLPTVKAWRRVGEYRPDVVITELIRDPRWIALAGSAPRIQIVHDDRPHDPDEELPAFERAVFERFNAGAAATVTYSQFVADAVAARGNTRSRVWPVPLPSDLEPGSVPPFVAADRRRDFVMSGRLNPYKNLDVVFGAWQQHLAGGGWRGDDLVLIGAGRLDSRDLPEHTRWQKGSYRYADVVHTLATAKGSVVHYRRASQSGVQVLSMQLGVMPIVSTSGALPEYQPVDCAPIGVDDVAGLTAAFDHLADPVVAARTGAQAARHYAQHFAVEHAAQRLLEVIAHVTARRP